MSLALPRPAKQGADKKERQAQTRKNVSKVGQNKVGSEGLVHVKAWKGGEGHGQGMYEVWWKETKCEKHKTQQSGGYDDT